MPTNDSEKKAILKVFWQDIRTRVHKIDSVLASIIDDLNPDQSLPLYLAHYPYGSVIADPEGFYLPGKSGNEMVNLSDDGVSKDVLADLGYAKGSLPMGMVLEKSIEYSIDLKGENITMPWLTYSAGSFFPFSRILSKKSQRVYAPNGVLTLTSGARSLLMLPNIGCTHQHGALQRDYNIQLPAPKTLYEHWEIFKEIASSPASKCDWRSCILFFSEKWLEKIHADPAWKALKLHIHELAWQVFEYQRNYIYYEMAFSMIQKKRNLKPNPYLVDTARHLYSIALGAAPGYIPSTDEDFLPLKVLQDAYINSYGLTKYFPTIMQAAHFKFEKHKLPIYYSLKHPSTYVFSPKSRKIFSALVEMRELEHTMRVFTQELQQKDEMCSDTIMSKIAQSVDFTYFHNEPDRHHIIKMATEIPGRDERFDQLSPTHRIDGAVFASDAPFVRGCVMIQAKKA